MLLTRVTYYFFAKNPHRITEGGQLDFCFDLIVASKKDRTVNKKVAGKLHQNYITNHRV